MLHVAGGPPVPVIPGGLPPPGHPMPVSAPHINPAFVSVASSSALPLPGGPVSIFANLHNHVIDPCLLTV